MRDEIYPFPPLLHPSQVKTTPELGFRVVDLHLHPKILNLSAVKGSRFEG